MSQTAAPLSIDQVLEDEKFETNIKRFFYHYLQKKGYQQTLRNYEAESKLFFSKDHFYALIRENNYEEARSYVAKFLPDQDNVFFILGKLELIYYLEIKQKVKAFEVLNDKLIPMTKTRREGKKVYRLLADLLAADDLWAQPNLSLAGDWKTHLESDIAILDGYLTNHNDLKDMLREVPIPNLRYIVQRFGDTIPTNGAATQPDQTIDDDDDEDFDGDADDSLMNWFKPPVLNGGVKRQRSPDNDVEMDDNKSKKPRKSEQPAASAEAPAAQPVPPAPVQPQPTPTPDPKPTVNPTPAPAPAPVQPTVQQPAPTPAPASTPAPAPATTPLKNPQPTVNIKTQPTPQQTKPAAAPPATPQQPKKSEPEPSTPTNKAPPTLNELPLTLINYGSAGRPTDTINRVNYSHAAGFITLVTSSNELKCFHWFDPRLTPEAKIDSSSPQEVTVEIETAMPINTTPYRAFCVISKNDSFFLLGGGSNTVRILTLKAKTDTRRSNGAINAVQPTQQKTLREVSKINITHNPHTATAPNTCEVTSAAFCPEDNNYYILGYSDGYVMVTKYGSNTGEECGFASTHGTPVHQLMVLPTHQVQQGTMRVAVVFANGHISIIDLTDHSDKGAGKRFVGKVLDVQVYNNSTIVKSFMPNTNGIYNMIEIRPDNPMHLAVKLTNYVILYDSQSQSLDKYAISNVTVMCFAHDGRSLLCGTRDGLIHHVPIHANQFILDPNNKPRVVRLSEVLKGKPISPQDYPTTVARNPKVPNQYCIGMSRGAYAVVTL